MHEKDYLAKKYQDKTIQNGKNEKIDAAVSQAIKETVLHSIEMDVNYGENFANLRQMYNALILATWFKRKLKDSLYKYYIDQNKTTGIDTSDKNAKEKIYNLYVEAFKKGVYNYVKRGRDDFSHKYYTRRYYSGGITALGIDNELHLTTISLEPPQKNFRGRVVAILTRLKGVVGLTSNRVSRNFNALAPAMENPLANFAQEIGDLLCNVESMRNHGEDILPRIQKDLERLAEKADKIDPRLKKLCNEYIRVAATEPFNIRKARLPVIAERINQKIFHSRGQHIILLKEDYYLPWIVEIHKAKIINYSVPMAGRKKVITVCV